MPNVVTRTTGPAADADPLDALVSGSIGPLGFELLAGLDERVTYVVGQRVVLETHGSGAA